MCGESSAICFPDAKLIGLDIGYFASCLTSNGIFPECKVDLQYFADIRNLPADSLRNVNAIVHLAGNIKRPYG